MAAANAPDPVFVLTVPRSGSSLLQHVLAAHSRVATAPEPWFLLPLIYAARDDGGTAPYDHAIAARAIGEFAGRYGSDAWDRAVRAAAESLYATAVAAGGASEPPRWFVDKTPRYWRIADELARIFPRARFICLYRNPAAVLTSVFHETFGGRLRWLLEADRRGDLLEGPGAVLAAEAALGEQAHRVRYEDLVADPAGTTRGLCRFLDLDFEPGMVDYGEKVRFAGSTFVDPTSVYRHDRPDAAAAAAWRERLEDPQTRALVAGYVTDLGADSVRGMGYDPAELAAAVAPPPRGRGLYPWRYVAADPATLSPWRRAHRRFRQWRRDRGLAHALRRAAAWLVRGR